MESVDNNEIAALRTKLTETISEHKSLLQYFKLHQGMRLHMILCDKCSKYQECQTGREMAQTITGTHKLLQDYFGGKHGTANQRDGTPNAQ